VFEGPEYESYLALCRELRLERALQDGDFVDDGVRPGVQMCGVTVAPGVMWHGGVWLPRLDQWLTMLEDSVPPWDGAAPWVGVALRRHGRVWFATDLGLEGREGYSRSGDSPEEAMARLWIAVTGKGQAAGSGDA
jgi:hypothetical protein